MLTALQKYLSMVQRMARSLARRLPANVELDDLVAAGNEGLWLALRSHPDASLTYVRIRVHGAMIDELRRQDWLSRRRRQKGGYEVGYLGDLPPGCEDPADPTAPRAIEVLSACDEVSHILGRAHRKLTEAEASIVALYYAQGASFVDIARKLGKSEPRISQLHARALRKLREAAESRCRGRAPGALGRRTRALEGRAVAMRLGGASLREIALATGLSKETVGKITPRVNLSQAMRRKHVQWRAEGRPNVPPRKAA